MMKKVKFLYTLVLTSLIILVGGKSLSYADSSVAQLNFLTKNPSS